MAASRSITFRGEVLALGHSGYAAAILPFVVCKKFFRTLFRLTLGLLWSELMEGKTADPQLTAVAFLIFCLLSLVSYYCRAYTGFFLLLFCLLWFVDGYIARHQVFGRGLTLPTSIECRGIWTLLQRQICKGQVEHIKFPTTQVAQISLVRAQIRGGAFQEILGTVWQTYLTLYDRSEWLFDETGDITLALEKANQLSYQFAVPVVVLTSEGRGKYAADAIDLPDRQQERTCPTIRCEHSAQQWHIYSQWQASSAWRLGKQVLERFGFLLFAVVVANLMIPFGALLHYCGMVWFHFQFGLGLSLEPFFFALRWQAIIELAAMLVFLIYQGAKISREEHLYITPDSLTFFLDTRKIAQIETNAIESVLFVRQPFPSLLILTQNQAIEIRELQHQAEFRVMLFQLNEALSAIQTLD